MEKLVYNQVTTYLNERYLFNEDQHGFLEKHFSTALLTICNEILRGMNGSEISLLSLNDLTRCFDVIDNGLLLEQQQLLQIPTIRLES